MKTFVPHGRGRRALLCLILRVTSVLSEKTEMEMNAEILRAELKRDDISGSEV